MSRLARVPRLPRIPRLVAADFEFSPAALFAAGEVGAWYDPSDLSTLFQDSAGTTPVTTPGQSVGLVLDKSQGLVLGANFATSANAILQAGVTYDSGTDTYTINSSSTNNLDFNLPTAAHYAIDIEYISGPGTLSIRRGNTSLQTITNASRTTYILNFAEISQILRINSATSGIVYRVHSVRELPGNHASQSVLASRPTYGIVPATGRRNLLTRTEEFDNAAWTKTNSTVTPNAGVAPDGTSTADRMVTGNTGSTIKAVEQLLGARGTGNYTAKVYVKDNASPVRVFALTVARDTLGNFGQAVLNLDTLAISTSTGGTGISVVSSSVSSVANGFLELTLSVNITIAPTNLQMIVQASFAQALAGDYLVWGAQLELGSTATAYQRVGSAFDITEAGVPTLHYLSFDGSDDWLVTPTITPGVDKAQVFAGVRKASDAAISVICEYSPIIDTNNGSFHLVQLISPNRYQWSSRGTTGPAAIAAVGASPLSSVLTGIGDISGDSAILRNNGVQVAQSTADQGTGNFLAYPLYIGRRGGTTLPFNGQIYSLIVRFSSANLAADRIGSTERWMGGKTGVSI